MIREADAATLKAIAAVAGGSVGLGVQFLIEVASAATVILGFFSVAVGLYVGVHRALEINRSRRRNIGELPEDEE